MSNLENVGSLVFILVLLGIPFWGFHAVRRDSKQYKRYMYYALAAYFIFLFIVFWGMNLLIEGMN